MLLAVDVVEVGDGVLQRNIADVAVEAACARLAICTDNLCATNLVVDFQLKVAPLQKGFRILLLLGFLLALLLALSGFAGIFFLVPCSTVGGVNSHKLLGHLLRCCRLCGGLARTSSPSSVAASDGTVTAATSLPPHPPLSHALTLGDDLQRSKPNHNKNRFLLTTVARGSRRANACAGGGCGSAGLCAARCDAALRRCPAARHALAVAAAGLLCDRRRRCARRHGLGTAACALPAGGPRPACIGSLQAATAAATAGPESEPADRRQRGVGEEDDDGGDGGCRHPRTWHCPFFGPAAAEPAAGCSGHSRGGEQQRYGDRRCLYRRRCGRLHPCV
eukprot:m.203926 g.203926  ORF g.203926 m.203926 type:complete len:334 (+) comp17740_c2_seq1:862-1863(+)